MGFNDLQALMARAAGLQQLPDGLCCRRSLEHAFKDLRGLMAKAAEMVQLAERFRGRIAEQSSTDDADVQEFRESGLEAELIQMGIASPVTKETAGGMYHQELARQVGQVQVVWAQHLQLKPAILNFMAFAPSIYQEVARQVACGWQH